MKANWAHSKGTQDWREAYKASIFNPEEGREREEGRGKREATRDRPQKMIFE
jgi:hypothetical protein